MKEYKDIYSDLLNKAALHRYLHHFTSLESFGLIVEGGQLLLNRLDNFSDKSENKYLSDLWQSKVFACCFTHSIQGKSRFWKEYAKDNGVRISFKNDLLTQENFQIVAEDGYVFPKRERTIPDHRQYDNVRDWGYFDISKVDVLYISPSDADDWVDCGNGLIKNCLTNDNYGWEEETRIRVALDPLGWENKLTEKNRFEIVRPSFMRAFLKLSPRLLESMIVSVPEKSTQEFVDRVRATLEKNVYTRNCEIYELSKDGNMILISPGDS